MRYLVALFFVISACKNNIELESKFTMHYSGHNPDILKIVSDINAEGKLNYLNSDKNSKNYRLDWDKAIVQGSANNSFNRLIIAPYVTDSTLIGYLETNVDYEANILCYKMIKPNSSEKRFETIVKMFKGQGLNLDSAISLTARAFAANYRKGTAANKVTLEASKETYGVGNENEICYAELEATYYYTMNPYAECNLQSHFEMIVQRIDQYFKLNASSYIVESPMNLVRIYGSGGSFSTSVIEQHIYGSIPYIKAEPCLQSFSWGQVFITSPVCVAVPNGPQPGDTDLPQELAINQKPLQEFEVKCDGLQSAWNNHPNNEVFGYLTTDNKFITTDIISIMGGQVSGLYEQDRKYYYVYKDTQGAPTLNYAGMVNSRGHYFIPVKASVHTHSESRTDGTNGLSNMVSEEAVSLAQKYPNMSHYVIGNGAVGTFNQWSSSYSVTAHGSIATTCTSIN